MGAETCDLENEIKILKGKIEEKDIKLKLYEESFVKNNSDAYIIDTLQSTIRNYEDQIKSYEQQETSFKNTIYALEAKLNGDVLIKDTNNSTVYATTQEEILNENMNQVKVYILEKEEEITNLQIKYQDLNMLYDATMDILVNNEKVTKEKEEELKMKTEQLTNTQLLLKSIQTEMENLKVMARILKFLISLVIVTMYCI